MSLLERIKSRVNEADGGCWEWQGGLTKAGYGQISVQNKKLYVHRVVYALLVGELVEGLTIDHLCSNRRCCNPDHLELVTQGENTRRALSYPVTHCKWGHEFNEENTYLIPSGGRMCRRCRTDRMMRYYAEKKGKG